MPYRVTASAHRATAARRTLRRRAGSLLLGLALAMPAVWAPAAAEPLPIDIEYQIKASFVYTVAKFVDWPSGAFASPTAPLTLGVIGDDAISAAIAEALKGKRVHERALVVRHLPDARSAADCQILYVDRGSATHPEILAQVQGPGILTVGEADGFARKGGILGLTLDQSLVQFEVNIAAAQRAGLVISSKILRLGRVVGDARPASEGKP
ncbi:MAG TPA: YfiR family protein [Dongiaceae bacterium]|nr:YfiR family protein [Dongiaceae bacterium]